MIKELLYEECIAFMMWNELYGKGSEVWISPAPEICYTDWHVSIRKCIQLKQSDENMLDCMRRNGKSRILSTFDFESEVKLLWRHSPDDGRDLSVIAHCAKADKEIMSLPHLSARLSSSSFSSNSFFLFSFLSFPLYEFLLNIPNFLLFCVFLYLLCILTSFPWATATE